MIRWLRRLFGMPVDEPIVTLPTMPAVPEYVENGGYVPRDADGQPIDERTNQQKLHDAGIGTTADLRNQR